jgi:hypothetical protein
MGDDGLSVVTGGRVDDDTGNIAYDPRRLGVDAGSGAD